MVKSITDCAVLNNGVKIPWLGFGVFQSEPGGVTERAVREALDAGYRHIDTAMIYENESDVGKAIRESGVPRGDIFVTTKVWNADQGFDSTLKAFDTSLKKLKMDYVDLYLVHWPVNGKYIETYKACEKLYRDGRTRAIGVSNFMVHHLDFLLPRIEVVPAMNQVETHPWLKHAELLRYCRARGIQLQGWAPLAEGQALTIPTVQEIGKKHGKSAAQVLIRWSLQRRVVAIPKSVTAKRIRENADVFDFQLSREDMSALNALDQDKHVGADPNYFDF